MENDDRLEQEIFVRLARLCGKSEQCTPDLVKKIRELGGDDVSAERILEKLVKEKFLDDDRYVKSYAREKFRIFKWGKVKIHYYLKMKGLSEAVIARGLEEIEPEAYIQLLVRTMKDKARTIKTGNKYEKMGQIIRFTQSRGFEPELIHRHINEVIS